jgi:DNA-3-methyladenine glycosylase II
MDFLNRKTLEMGLSFLATSDPDLAGILTKFGPPPIWARKSGFSTLIHILEQQVSLASARAAFDRLVKAGRITPDRFLALDETLSRPLVSVGRGRATAANGALSRRGPARLSALAKRMMLP